MGFHKICISITFSCSKAIRAEHSLENMVMSQTPIFHRMQSSSSTKGYISRCYAILLPDYLEHCPNSAKLRWDIGDISSDQREEALETVRLCSMNMSNRLSTIHFTEITLHRYWESILRTLNSAFSTETLSHAF